MLHSKTKGGWIGFSTGALELGDFWTAVRWMIEKNIKNVELSALRFDELGLLVSSLSKIPAGKFDYISIHAPSSFQQTEERNVIELLRKVNEKGWNIIVHPDVIYTPKLWKEFGPKLLVENMDRRKKTGRTAEELAAVFTTLPFARMCLDVAHARQLDNTLKTLDELISKFWDKVEEIHISELDSEYRHRPMSNEAVADYQKFPKLGDRKRIIIESMLNTYETKTRMDEFKIAEKVIMTNNKIYVERRPEGDYAVRRAGSERASAVEPTQRQAIERARELSPGISPHVERVRNTPKGSPDKWRHP
jgi:hypothetical protein